MLPVTSPTTSTPDCHVATSLSESVCSMADQEPKLSKLEYLKADSRQLRGTIGEELLNDEDHFSGDSAQLLKFHGSYQQDDRDQRNRKDESGKRLGKVYSCMLRTGLPGGVATAEQFLKQMDLCDTLGEGTMRLTTRQAIQLHGIPKHSLRQVIHDVNKAGMTSLSACGDVNRNVMCNPVPRKDSSVIEQMHETANAISAHLKPRSKAYFDFWVTDEFGEKQNLAEQFEPVEEPIYGATYLPRKFKIGIALPEDNHVDIMTQDIGLLGIVEGNELIGFDVYTGGGMGRTPSAEKTFPAIGKGLAFIPKEETVALCEAIVKVQRDFGNREDRKVARMKYLIADWGIEKFRAKVAEYYGQDLQPMKGALITGVDDYMGWREQGDGKLFVGVNIENGRIKDDGDLRIKTGLRTILEKYKMPVRLTALQSILLCDIDPADRDDITRLLAEHGLKPAEELSPSRRFSIACPALPMCGLSITESERVMPDLMDQLDAELEQQGLQDEVVSVHMTGCPNGCARPYTPDVGLVGKAVGKYTVFLGGNARGTRLAFIYQDMVKFEDIVPTLSPLLSYFKQERTEGETFGDFCDRKGLEDLLNHTGLAASA